jgi:hypothetical protein
LLRATKDERARPKAQEMLRKAEIAEAKRALEALEERLWGISRTLAGDSVCGLSARVGGPEGWPVALRKKAFG